MSPKRYRILVVEDHPFLLASTMAALQSSGCHVVDGAKDGGEALRLLSEQPYDLVISDLHMPEMDGVQLIERFPVQRRISPALAIVSGDSIQISSGACQAAKARGLPVLGAYPKPFSKDTADALLRALDKHTAMPFAGQPLAHRSPADMLVKALENQEIQAWHQPKYCLSGQRIVGVEALARWVHPQLGLLLPQAFMPDIEREGLYERLLWAMLRQSIAAQYYWKSLGHEITVSVNLHTRLLDDLSLPGRLHKFVMDLGAKPSSICFELTENSTTTEASSYYSGASRLRMMGFGLSQDDFSTGYSSFYRLVATPFTELKVDRSMVQSSIGHDAFRTALTSLIRLGKDLGLSVVAEGVETHEELTLLRSLGCDMIQGFLISPAVDARALGELLDPKNSPRL
ncbi:EAL domain-containing protein [Pusillimonas sp. SM2304]|uniref:EAL domain-containing response regulator n=1 Tax=Pusillimonas sp. SM2304 TaxID=3073241 RepID=UPI00287415B6|nr:EAL domain-containing protein [Pusillimonas sp. SM2304]MDS1138893.1 EAL domain-containing protein [Pusillimonas sp. SM2304]